MGVDAQSTGAGRVCVYMYGMGGVRRDRPSEHIFSKSGSFSGSLKCTGLRWGLELEKSRKKVRSTTVSTALIYLEKVVREQKHFYVFAPPPVNKGHMSCLQHRLSLSTPNHMLEHGCVCGVWGGSPGTHMCVWVNVPTSTYIGFVRVGNDLWTKR